LFRFLIDKHHTCKLKQKIHIGSAFYLFCYTLYQGRWNWGGGAAGGGTWFKRASIYIAQISHE
jgi:hypothetical protein